MLIDLMATVWFPLGSGDETMFCDTKKLFSARLPVKVLKTLNERQSLLEDSVNKTLFLRSIKQFRIA